MKRKIIVLALVVVILASSILTVLATSDLFSAKNEEFYVGVTYCGDNATDAKMLIDKVKDYTNLFVLDSGTLQYKPEIINEIGDYAVDQGLHYIIFFGVDSASAMQNWNEIYDGHWNSSFLGVYFGDEPGGKMLDSERQFYDSVLGSIMKYANGDVQCFIGGNGSVSRQVRYSKDGTINLQETYYNHISDLVVQTTFSTIVYYLNGTITQTTRIETQNLTQITSIGTSSYLIAANSTPPATIVVIDNSTLEYTYDELWNSRPIQTYDQAEQWYVVGTSLPLNRYRLQNITYLTSDYCLYWYDYLSGYDVVLAQLGWNHTDAQVIGLVRGAANLQNKSWGTIITWKYMQEPYLASGQEIYDQLKLSYQCGASYVLVFNYAENMTGPFGTLKEDHFQALSRFWNDVVKSPFERKGSMVADKAFLFPHNFGSGLRKPDDTVWGLWQPSVEQQQIYLNMQKALVNHGLRIDIVYEDAAYPITGRYSKTIYWNQTAPNFPILSCNLEFLVIVIY